MSYGLAAQHPLGSQTPRVESVPPWVTSGGDKAVALAGMTGQELDPWQSRLLQGALGQTASGRFSAPEVGIVIPRQNGKTVVIEVAILSGIYLQHLQVVYTAHLMATSRRTRMRIQQLIESTPDLEREVKQIRISNEEQSIELKSGARVDFVARSGSTARGWSGDMVFMDEAFAVADDHIGALMPIMFARPNWQLWYASSAGKPASHALRRIRQRGIEGDPGLAYYEWSIDEEVYKANPEAVAASPEMWAKANPSYGIRITGETLALAQRSMDAVEFAREVLGVWDDPRGAPLIDPLSWSRLMDPLSQITGSMVFALDVSPGLETGAIGAAGLREDGLTHIEITGRDGQLDHRRGVDWMVARVVELDELWQPAAWVLDPSGPAGALVTDLIDAGIEIQAVTVREVAHASGAMLKAASSPPSTSQIRHLGQIELDEAVRAAKKRDVGDGGWAFGRRVTEQDISPLVAVTLALHGLAIHGAARYDVLQSVF
jgi:phage terminase large subunit-like protein